MRVARESASGSMRQISHQWSRRAALGGLAAALAALQAFAAPMNAPVPVPRPALPDPTTRPAPGQTHSGAAGWIMIDLDSGEVLDAMRPDTAFVPASVAKLPTTFYALDRLGAAHRFQTRVAVTGARNGETLEGDLFLIGGGDPELDTDDLLPLVTQSQSEGFRRVAGRFLVDGALTLPIEAIDLGQPVDAAYNPSVSGLNLNFNRVRLKWDARGGRREMRVSAKAVRLDPEVTGVRVDLASARGAPMFSYRLEEKVEAWQMNESGFRGKGARWLPVRRPELYAGEAFQGLARTYGITLDAARLGAAPAGVRIIATHESRPLAPMLAAMLRYSTNLTAEAVGMAAARADGQPARDLATSAAAMNDWAAELAGFAAGDQGFQLANHSGLSLDSRVSPRRMAEVLAAFARRQPATGERRPKLPGGALELLRDYNVAAKSVKLDYKNLDILAKTGTMDYVRGLAGYIATPSGRRLAFAIFSNDLDRREPGTTRINKRWMARARNFERNLIRSWVRRLEG